MKKSEHKVFPSRLENKTLELLSKLDRRITYVAVAKATGLEANWIGFFMKGKLKHPSIGRVETLYNYLSGKTLDV